MIYGLKVDIRTEELIESRSERIQRMAALIKRRSKKGERVAPVDDRLDRLEVKVDQGFAALGERFEQVDERFKQIDKRFDEQRSQFQAMHEEHMQTFRSLYDLMKGHGERLDANSASNNAVLKNHERRLLILEGRATTKA